MIEMKYYRLFFITISIILLFSGCGQYENPLESEDISTRQEGDGSTSLLTAGATFLEDDFESGIDTDVWYLENVGNVQWTHTTEDGNGYIYSPPQSPYVWTNRYIDILTHADDFQDFELTFDLRMQNSGYHQDQRLIYIRSTDDFVFPYGYHIMFAYNKQTVVPPNFIMIYKVLPGYTYVYLTPSLEFNWILGQWHTFRIQAEGAKIRVKVWLKDELEPAGWTMECEDPENSYTSGRIGFGDYWGSITDVDNVRISPLSIKVDLDIKPCSCPNPFNFKSSLTAVMPAAILGSEGLDVTEIDVSSILLEGVSPIRYALEDVAAPSDGIDCECVEEGPDGFMDLTLKFNAASITQVIGEVTKGEIVTLKISGVLLDGTPFEGTDCIILVGPNPTKLKAKK